MKQTTNHILMIRPSNFRMNEETSKNNYYQKSCSNLNVKEKSLKEFDSFVAKLRDHEIHVVVFQDRENPDTPDSVFPNNWISFHQNGFVALYPMFAKNRRLERRTDILDMLMEKGYTIDKVIDYTYGEDKNSFLEGTGSMVLDRRNKKAYASLSPRTNEELFLQFCEDFIFKPVVFHAYQTVGEDVRRLPIYHTNVMMSVGETFALICLDSIDDCDERETVVTNLKNDGKEIIQINEYQAGKFAGNMLQVHNSQGTRYLVMSLTAYKSLSPQQILAIEKHCQIISSDLSTIEACGGGSARCMMAELFISKQT
ncbi:uncharacterized protein [Lepeophtheirus salmonis]